MSETTPTTEKPVGENQEEEEEQELGEGWVGVTRPAEKPAPPPVADRSNRRQLYTNVVVKEVDAETFSETAKSTRVWWTPEDDEQPDAEYEPFEVDVADNPITKKYKVGATTRRGDFYVIKSATGNDGKAVSIKSIHVATARMLGQSPKVLAKEIEMFQLCGKDNDNVCNALELSEAEDTLCLVLEEVAGAPLNIQLTRGDENYHLSDARRLISQCASAVAAVHAAGVVHRDILPDNFVFTARDNIERVKLCDFSLAVKTSEPIDEAPGGGDPEFQAPELVNEQLHGAPVDIWSLGCVAHLLLAGAPPVHDTNNTRLCMKIGKGDLNLGNPDVWPKEAPGSALEFIKALLTTNPDQRPNAAGVVGLPFLAASDDVLLANFKASLKQWNNTR